MKFRSVTLFLFISILVFSNTLFAQQKLTLSTTTSTYETGLLDHILKPFEEKYNVKVHIISVGTGKAIKLAENGDADVILVHARKAEDKFITEGYGVNRRDVMYNDFVILGPEDDPADVKGMKNPAKAFGKIFKSEHTFLSRGDDSGTNKKEKQIWKEAGLNPNTQNNSWYLESGQGQAATLRIADEKNGYVMLDRGTFLFHKSNVRLEVLVEGGKKLLNPYGIIAVNPYKHKHTNYEMAMALITWITSPKCQEMIAKFTVNGNIMFYKNANNQINELSN